MPSYSDFCQAVQEKCSGSSERTMILHSISGVTVNFLSVRIVKFKNRRETEGVVWESIRLWENIDNESARGHRREMNIGGL
jgi:hypothetical protein